MSIDGNLLARAREKLRELKLAYGAETERRRAEAFARVPELSEIDASLRSLMTSAVAVTLGLAPKGTTISGIGENCLALQQRQAELLAEHGWPIDYIDEIVGCRACGDTGFVRGEMCACLKELYRAEQAKDLSRMLDLGCDSFEKFELKHCSPEFDPELGESPLSHMERVLNTCKNYASRFSPGSPSLLFQGGTGLGKTFLSACIAKSVSSRGFSVVYDTAVSALGAFEEQKFSRSPEDTEKASSRVRQMLECDLMILDDLGTEMTTSFSVSALYTLINTRLASGRAAVISTNLDFNELARRYSQQILSRLKGEFLILDFVGSDIRLFNKGRGAN